MGPKSKTVALEAPEPPSGSASGPGHRTRVGQERRRRTGDRILQAVFNVIDSAGADPVTVEQIRFAAGLSRGSFYNYFPAVTEVLAHVSALIWRQVDAEQNECFRDIANPVERLCCYLRYGIARGTSDSACGYVLWQSLPVVGTFHAEMRERMICDFTDAQARRMIDVPSIETAVDLTMGMVVAMLHDAVTKGPDAELISLQSVIVMRALGVSKDRAVKLAGRPIARAPAMGIRAKVLAHGWVNAPIGDLP